MQEFSPMQWHQIKADDSKDAPKPRSGHRIISYNGQIFSFGGYNPDPSIEDPSAHLLQEFWKLNLATNQWENLELKGKLQKDI